MKYRCPHCGSTFQTKITQCPKCGKVLRYKSDQAPSFKADPKPRVEPTAPSPQTNLAPEALNAIKKEPLSPTPFNVWNFLTAVVGLIFFIDALFGVHFFYIQNVHGVRSEIPFALFDLLLRFIANFNDISQAFSTQGVFAGLNLIFKDFFGLIDIIFIAFSIIVQAVLVIKNFIHLVSKTLPSVARDENMGNQGQLRGGWAVLIFTYSCVFVPYIFGLIYINTRGNVMVLDQIAHLFIDNTYFHGLTYYHLVFLGLFILMFVFHLIRRGQQKKLRMEFQHY